MKARRIFSLFKRNNGEGKSLEERSPGGNSKDRLRFGRQQLMLWGEKNPMVVGSNPALPFAQEVANSIPVTSKHHGLAHLCRAVTASLLLVQAFRI